MNFIKNLIRKIRKNLGVQLKSVNGENNTITNKGNINKVTFDIIGNNNVILIGKGSSINNALIYIRGNHHQIIIGDNCYFGEGELWLEDHHCQLVIKDNTTVERGHLAVTEPYSKLEIGEDCMLAKFVEIRTGDSHSIVDQATGERINKAANVVLEDHVWVGAHAKILKGVTIGHHSVIGTTSVVSRDVPPHSIAAGIPAKVIRSGIDWKRERF